MTTNQQETDMLINLDELKESVEFIPATNNQEVEEIYEVVDIDPSRHLPEDVMQEIMNDEELLPIQEELDYVTSNLIAIQNRLTNAVQTKVNQRKEQMIAQQKAEQEEAVMQGMSNQDTLRAMALVAELMHSMPWVVLEALDTLKNGGAPASAMQRITASLIPSVEPYNFMTAEVQQAASSEPTAQTEAKPFKSKKWSPNG